MRRYNPETNCQHGSVYEDRDGDFVFFEHAQKEIVARDKRIAELERDLATTKKLLAFADLRIKTLVDEKGGV